MKILPNAPDIEYYNKRKIRKYVDKNIQDLIIKLNELPFVQATYSCGGHFYTNENSIKIVSPCIDFFCDVSGLYVPKYNVAANIFIEKVKELTNSYSLDNIPKVIEKYIRNELELEYYYPNMQGSDLEESLLEELSDFEPEFICKINSGCSFNGSKIEAKSFLITNHIVPISLRNWHKQMLQDIEIIITNI